jgi:MSHA biogenesis protein MshM
VDTRNKKVQGIVVRQTFYFSDGPYLQAMHGLHSALSGAEAFIKFIGQPRTGKSGVCEKLTQYMRLKDYRVLYFDYAIESPDMLRSRLATELDIPDTVNILRHLEDVLQKEAEKPLLLIFDDAHLLSDITLIEIYRLISVQVEQKRIINIVLCGEPLLERRLSNKQEFKTLLQHVSHNFLLEPMDSETSSHFLLDFLERMQLPGLQLEAAALNQFYKSCKGYPGPAYSLCQLLLSIRQHDQELLPVTKEELLRAIRSADGEQPVPSGQLRDVDRRLIAAPIVAVIIIASLALLMRQLSPPETPPQTEDNTSLSSDDRGEQAATGAGPSPFVLDETTAEQVIVNAHNEVAAGKVISEQALENAAEYIVASNVGAVANPVAEAPASSARAEQEIVSDSNLSLVTAQQRGVSARAISTPQFEELALIESNNMVNSGKTKAALAEDSAASFPVVNLANVTLTRPMFAIDDEDDEVAIDDAELAAVRISEPAAADQSSAVRQDAISNSAKAEEVVQAWVLAWQQRDLDNYFASYDEDFIPRYHRSKNAWHSNRQRVIGNAAKISLEVSDFAVVSEDADSIEVHFWLAYRSPTYGDDTRKKLVLRKLPSTDQQARKLLILEEINLEVQDL